MLHPSADYEKVFCFFPDSMITVYRGFVKITCFWG